jgi:hypothetical protein
MQEIKLIHFTLPEKESCWTRDNYYRFWVPGNRFYFKSMKKMLKFIADVNRNLNLTTHEINSLVADVYTEYRTYYFHLNSTERQKTDSKFSGLNKMFGLMIVRSEGPNGSSYVYDWLDKILISLQNIVKFLQQHPMNKINTIQRYRLENINMRITACKDRLKWFPNDGFEKHETNPTD